MQAEQQVDSSIPGLAQPSLAAESSPRMDVDPATPVPSNTHLAVPRLAQDVPKSPSTMAIAGSPAEERERLLEPAEAKPPDLTEAVGDVPSLDRVQTVAAQSRTASIMAAAGSPASEREQLLDPYERNAIPSSGSSDAGSLPGSASVPISAPSTPPKRLSALPPHLQRHSALPQLAVPSGPPSPALSIQPGPPTPTGTSPLTDSALASNRAEQLNGPQIRSLQESASLPDRTPAATLAGTVRISEPEPVLAATAAEEAVGVGKNEMEDDEEEYEPTMEADEDATMNDNASVEVAPSQSDGNDTHVRAEPSSISQATFSGGPPASVTASNIYQTPQSSTQTRDNINEIIEARIRAVTSGTSPPNSALRDFSSPFPSTPAQSYAMQAGVSQPQSGFAVPGLPASRMPQPSLLQAPPSVNQVGLPQDIAHILESEFVSQNAAELEEARKRREARDKEVRRLASQMKRKAELGESGSGLGNGSSSDSEETSSEDSTISDDESDGGSGDEDGSGDEEKEKAERAKVLETIRMEIEEATNGKETPSAVPADADADEASSSSSDFDASVLTGTSPQPPTTRKRRNRKRGRGKSKVSSNTTAAAAIADSDVSSSYDSDLDDRPRGKSGAGGAALKTEHEIADEEAVATGTRQLPFEKVPAEQMARLAKLGVVASVIGNVVVVSGDKASGGLAVLDEGSLVCWEDGAVIGRIFETFGAVTSPHYTIRFPTSAPTLLPSPPFAVGAPVFFVPSHSAFVFTKDLQQLPKGSDASNIWDEEVGAGEIEFSDDEAEQAYRQMMKRQNQGRSPSVASSSGGFSRGRRGRGGRGPSASPRASVDIDMRADESEMRAAVKTEGDDGDGYNVLQRPSGGLNYDDPPAPSRSRASSFGSQSDAGYSDGCQSRGEGRGQGRSKGGRGGGRGGRGRGGRGRGSERNSPEHHSHRPIATLPRRESVPPATPLPSFAPAPPQSPSWAPPGTPVVGYNPALPSMHSGSTPAPAPGYRRFDLPPPQGAPLYAPSAVGAPQNHGSFHQPPPPAFSAPPSLPQQPYGVPAAYGAFQPTMYGQQPPGYPPATQGFVPQQGPPGGGHYNPRFFSGGAPPPWMYRPQ